MERVVSRGFETLADARSSTTEGPAEVRWLRRARNEPVSKPPDLVVSRRSPALAPQAPNGARGFSWFRDARRRSLLNHRRAGRGSVVEEGEERARLETT